MSNGQQNLFAGDDEIEKNIVYTDGQFPILKTHVTEDTESLIDHEISNDNSAPSSSSQQELQCGEMDIFYNQIAFDNSICQHCGEDLTNKRYYNHLFDYHGYTKAQLDLLKSQRRIEEKKKTKKNFSLFICECGLQFVSKTGLYKHKVKVHDVVDRQPGPIDNIVCPSYGCEMSFFTYLDLAIHVDSCHRNLVTMSEAFRIHRVMFRDHRKFLNWKREMEKVTSSEFFVRTTQKVSYAAKTILFKCNYSNSRGQPKGRRCEQCPSFIRLCERFSGKIEIVACFGHLGHEHVTETKEARQLRELKWTEIVQKICAEEEQQQGESSSQYRQQPPDEQPGSSTDKNKSVNDNEIDEDLIVDSPTRLQENGADDEDLLIS